MTFQDYQTWFDRLPYAKQLTLQREAGFSEAHPDFKQLVAAAAERAGLARSAAAVEVLYARQHGAIGCPSCGGRCSDGPVGEPTDCVAVEFPLADISLDPARFQNRTDAFSELSAEAVARHYDPNKFDPVVLWRDPATGGRAFMLSGHSRFEGMSRRKARTIPVRFFQGTEAEAIQFARVDANRAATAENLVEDLTAYRLMRDGDPARNLKPAKKTELAQAFKGKQSKLEAWSHLDPAGLFVATLAQDNRSEFPYLEKFALWVGQLRGRHAELTNTHEADCFNFFYSDAKHQRTSRADFDELIEKRLAWGKPRLFPECGRDGCVDLQDLAKRGAQADTYKQLEALAKYRETITQRLRTTDRGMRVYTDSEREKLKEQGQLIDLEMQRLRRDLGQAEAAPGLFGPGDLQRGGPRYFPGLTVEDGDFRNLEDMLYLIRQHLEAVGYNDQDRYVAFRVYADEKKVARLLLDLDAVEPQIVVTAPLPVFVVVIPKQFFGLVDALLKQKRIDYQYQLPK